MSFIQRGKWSHFGTMDKSPVLQWLTADKKDYAEGVALFKQFIDHKALNRVFNRPQNGHRLAKLIYHLEVFVGPLELAKAKTAQVKKKPSQTPVKKAKPRQAKPQMLDALQQEIRSLYDQRMALGDQLQDDQGKPHVVEQNRETLDKMEPLRLRAIMLREKMMKLAKGEPLTEIEEEGPVVIQLRGEAYTQQDLWLMDFYALKDLRERVYQIMRKAKIRANDKKTKPATQKRNAEKAAIKSQELVILDQVKKKRDKYEEN